MTTLELRRLIAKAAMHATNMHTEVRFADGDWSRCRRKSMTGEPQFFMELSESEENALYQGEVGGLADRTAKHVLALQSK